VGLQGRASADLVAAALREAQVETNVWSMVWSVVRASRASTVLSTIALTEMRPSAARAAARRPIDAPPQPCGICGPHKRIGKVWAGRSGRDRSLSVADICWRVSGHIAQRADVRARPRVAAAALRACARCAPVCARRKLRDTNDPTPPHPGVVLCKGW